MKSLIACCESVVEPRPSRQTRLPQPADETKVLSVSVVMAFARDKPVTRSRRSVADIGKITYNEKCHVHASQNRDVDETLAREVPPSDMARYFVGTLREWKGVPYVARSVPHALPGGGQGQEHGEPLATVATVPSAYIKID